jgi:hypothetical protein
MESLRSSADFGELLSFLNAEGASYLIIGGFALAHYGRPRYTKDLDLWVEGAGDNPDRVYRALARFGAALDGVNPDDFRDPDCVFQIGVEPLRVDILNDISGVAFAEAWPRRIAAKYPDVPVFVISPEDLIANKRASGRPSDQRDVQALLEDQSE